MEQIIKSAVAAEHDALLAIVQEMYDHPELGGEEKLAADLHVAYLEKHGFTMTRGVYGWETSYCAHVDSGKPGLHVGLLAEYDALPGIGHGCGHNSLGCCTLAAGVALKAVLDQVGGSITVFGTPAEETSGAKVDFAAQGAFDNVDIALICHPGNHWAKSGTSLALAPVRFEFFGKSAHAAACPEEGINALDGAVITMNAINALREHVRDDARIHGIIADGGKAANIVPDYARADYYVRATKKSYLTQLSQRVENCARAGALASGTELKISQYEYGYDNLLTNNILCELYSDILLKEYGIAIHPANANTGSTDMGNVSLVCPSIHMVYDIAGDSSIIAHSTQMADCTITEYGMKGMETAAAVTAMTAAKVMMDADLMASIKAEFEAAEK